MIDTDPPGNADLQVPSLRSNYAVKHLLAMLATTFGHSDVSKSITDACASPAYYTVHVQAQSRLTIMHAMLSLLYIS